MFKFSNGELLLGTVAVLLFLWYINFHFKRRRMYKLASYINGPPTIPVLGNMLKFLIPSKKWAEKIIEAITYYKSPTKVWFGPQLLLHIWDPKQVQVILNSPHCMGKPKQLYKLTEPVVGQGLLVLEADEWKRHRRIIAPALNQTNVNSFVNIINKHIKCLVEDLKCKQGQGFFDIKKYLLKNSLDIALDAILGFDGIKNDADTEQFLAWLENIQTATVHRMTKVWYLPDILFNMTPMGWKLQKSSEQFVSHIQKVINQWKEETLLKHQHAKMYIGLTDPSKPVKFVEYLLSMSNGVGKLTSEELLNEVQTVIVAAFDTTALTLGSILLVLGMFPDIQDKVYKEAMQMLPSDGQFGCKDYEKLEYIERVIKESMRIFPAGPGIARTVDQELQLDKYIIPAGCIILIGLLGLHRDPSIWPNPTTFDPDRFLPKEEDKRHPYSWLGFSAGPRNCVGLRFALIVLKAAVIEIIRNYRIGTIYKDIDDVELNCIFLFQPTRGYKIKLDARE